MPRPRTIAFWKPYGVVTQFTGEPPTLASYIDVPGVYACGRLDKDSEGLLLLTSDGALQHEWTDPKFAHEKTYWAQVEGVPAKEAIEALRRGVMIQGEYRTRPARVRVIGEPPDLPPRNPPIRYRAAIPTAWLELVLTEGRNRQVRRMTAAVGLPTLRLVRYAIGAITLEGLAPGKWRDVALPDLTTRRRR